MKTKILAWFRNNWFLLCVIIVAFFFLKKWGTGYFEYKHEIRALNDSIAFQGQIISLSENREAAARELIRSYEHELKLYQDSLSDEKIKRINQKYRHEKEILYLKRIPTDSIYLDVTRWLDSLSF